MPRYQVVPDSVSSHCCFRATVIDSKSPSKFYPGLYETVCECFSLEDANKVADALNAVEPKH